MPLPENEERQYQIKSNKRHRSISVLLNAIYTKACEAECEEENDNACYSCRAGLFARCRNRCPARRDYVRRICLIDHYDRRTLNDNLTVAAISRAVSQEFENNGICRQISLRCNRLLELILTRHESAYDRHGVSNRNKRDRTLVIRYLHAYRHAVLLNYHSGEIIAVQACKRELSLRYLFARYIFL